MSANDQEYFRQRSAKERELAAAAVDPKIAAIHLQMAVRYETLAAGGTIMQDDPDKAPVTD